VPQSYTNMCSNYMDCPDKSFLIEAHSLPVKSSRNSAIT
jgi:hypothetical protein